MHPAVANDDALFAVILSIWTEIKIVHEVCARLEAGGWILCVCVLVVVNMIVFVWPPLLRALAGEGAMRRTLNFEASASHAACEFLLGKQKRLMELQASNFTFSHFITKSAIDPRCLSVVKLPTFVVFTTQIHFTLNSTSIKQISRFI